MLDPYLHQMLEAPIQKLLWRPCVEEGIPTAPWSLQEKIRSLNNVLKVYYASCERHCCLDAPLESGLTPVRSLGLALLVERDRVARTPAGGNAQIAR